MTTARTRAPAPSPRRKPRQSRARQTSQALQEAFVRLLVEHGYAGVTIREITAVAGTGLGSFYEYFSSKEDLARVCIHLRSKALLATMRAAVDAQAGRPLAEVVDAVIDALLAVHRAHPQEWGAHYLLERHLSGAEAYRKMYERFVDEWVHAIESAAGAQPGGAARREAARVSQTIVYGLFAHAFIGAGAVPPDTRALARQARTAIAAYLRAAADADR